MTKTSFYKHMNPNSNYIYFFVTIIFLFISCRENTISPDNFATNVNEPILINESNSYMFIINAQNISIDVINSTNFNANTSKVSIKIVDYASGNVSVRIIDRQSNSRFNYFGNDNESFFVQSLNGYVPASVGIKMVDFSGKLRIELNRTF